MIENNVRPGKVARVHLCDFLSDVSSGNLAKGTWFAVKAKAESDSVFGALEVGEVGYANAALTLASGDVATPIKAIPIGGATDKSFSESKSSDDVSCDKDGNTKNYITSGIVDISGSISMYDIQDEAQEAINRLFTSIIKVDAQGNITKLNANTTKKVCLLFIWDEPDPTGIQAADFLPAMVSNKERSASYSSGQTANLSFQGCATDEAGHKRTSIVISNMA